MISESTVAYFELTETAVYEIVLLMSLYDCGGWAEAYEILHHARQQQYFRHSPTRLADTLQHMPAGAYVERGDRDYILTREGKVRLRDLCELGHASPSSARQLNREAFKRMRHLRSNLGIFPFTGGRPVAAGPRVRNQDGHSVYAILLQEAALQRWYQIRNSTRNPRLPCVYVGMTSQSPLERFDGHRFGWKKRRSKYVDLFGLCLVPLLYSALNVEPLTREEALKIERQFARALRQNGFAVFAGHHDKMQDSNEDYRKGVRLSR